ncbi:BH0509 family protein [Bacillus cereus]
MNKKEQEKFHLMEWIILISDTNPYLLEKLSNEEIEKNYLKSIENY